MRAIGGLAIVGAILAAFGTMVFTQNSPAPNGGSGANVFAAVPIAQGGLGNDADATDCQHFTVAVTAPPNGAEHGCGSFQKACSLASAGDTIEVYGQNGNYPAQTLIKGSGSNTCNPASTVTFRCAAGDTCNMGCQTNASAAPCGTSANFQLGTGSGTNFGPSHLTFDGINLVDLGFHIQDWNATDGQVSFIQYENAHIWATSNSGTQPYRGILFDNNSGDHITVGPNVELGPFCCDGDMLDSRLNSASSPGPTNILITGAYLHDGYDSCTNMPAGLYQQYGCDGAGFGDVPNGAVGTLTNAIDAAETSFAVTLNGPAANGAPLIPLHHPFPVSIDSEDLWVTSVVANGGSSYTFNVAARGTSNQSSCDQTTAATHLAGAGIHMCNSADGKPGYAHMDAIQDYGCNVCSIVDTRIVAGNPATGTSMTGGWCNCQHAGQAIFFQAANGGTFSNLTFQGDMVSCFCGTNVFSMAAAGGGNGGNFSGFIHFYNDTVNGNGIIIYDVGGSCTTSPNNCVLAPGTQVSYVNDIVPGTIHGSGSSPSNGCTFHASDGSVITPTYSHDLFSSATFAACDPSNFQGTASYMSADYFTPDLRLNGAQTAIDNGDLSICGSVFTTDLFGNPCPGPDGQSNIGADQGS